MLRIKLFLAARIPFRIKVIIRPADTRCHDPLLRNTQSMRMYRDTDLRTHRQIRIISKHISPIIFRNVLPGIKGDLLHQATGMPELYQRRLRTLFTGRRREKVVTDKHILRSRICPHKTHKEAQHRTNPSVPKSATNSSGSFPSSFSVSYIRRIENGIIV